MCTIAFVAHIFESNKKNTFLFTDIFDNSVVKFSVSVVKQKILLLASFSNLRQLSWLDEFARDFICIRHKKCAKFVIYD